MQINLLVPTLDEIFGLSFFGHRKFYLSELFCIGQIKRYLIFRTKKSMYLIGKQENHN